MAYTIQTGDPCPCCGQPVPLTDPAALVQLTRLAELLGLPIRPADRKDAEECL